jgi:hypothetical protein
VASPPSVKFLHQLSPSQFDEAESHYSARFMISLFCQPVFVEVGVL